MKRRDVMKKLQQIAQEQGLELQVKEGGRHTLVRIGDRFDTVPRHKEVNELTARAILDRMSGRKDRA